jgi:hypothetical protein
LAVPAGQWAAQPDGRHWWSVQPPRLDTPSLTTSRAYTEVLVVFGVFFAAGVAAAAFSVIGESPSGYVNGWQAAVPGSISQVATTVLSVLVPVLLVGRRGLGAADLGLVKPGTVSPRVGIRVAAWALLGLIAGSAVTGSLATANFPFGRFSYPNLTVNLFHDAQAGFIEEVVVLAFVVTTLEQARRPRNEIIVVALLLRATYHIYYGPGVVGIFVWAALFLWLFLRFRTIVPLIIVHSTWDILVELAHWWPTVGVFEVLGWLALLLVSFILWLADRRPARPAGPGWDEPG